MTIEPGRSLLHDRLVAELGESGMGVLWKGLDPPLDRVTSHERLARGNVVSGFEITKREGDGYMIRNESPVLAAHS